VRVAHKVYVKTGSCVSVHAGVGCAEYTAPRLDADSLATAPPPNDIATTLSARPSQPPRHEHSFLLGLLDLVQRSG